MDIEGKDQSKSGEHRQVAKDVLMVVDVSGSMTGTQSHLTQTIVEVGMAHPSSFVYFYLFFFRSRLFFSSLLFLLLILDITSSQNH